MKHLITITLLTLLVLGGCTETNTNTWDVALECTNEKYARETTLGWYQENYIFLNTKRERVQETRAKFSTEKEGLLWATKYVSSEGELLLLGLNEYRWFGKGEWYYAQRISDRMTLNRETLVLTWEAHTYGLVPFEQTCKLSTLEKLKAKIEIVEAYEKNRLEAELKHKEEEEREKAEQLKKNKI